MTERWRLLIPALLLFCCCAAFFIVNPPKPLEPIYEGRPLSAWMDAEEQDAWIKADQAIRALGTNGIPFYLEMLRAKDPPNFIMNLAERNGWRRLTPGSTALRNAQAERAFGILATNAAPAVPELIRIYERNISDSSQMNAALSLRNIGPPARAALPALLKNFSHTNQDVRFYAISAILDIGGDPNVLIPPLVLALKDPYPSARWNAMVAIQRLGRQARPAAPEILKLTNDHTTLGQNAKISELAQDVLWHIAPETVGEPFVIEADTPLIKSNATTAAIKSDLFNERNILIPAGTPLPAIAQHWNSDPRPKLTFYRETPTGQDHLLGHFEVLDVDATQFVNISTRCIVFDGKILLTARDNTRKKFLKIRSLID